MTQTPNQLIQAYADWLSTPEQELERRHLLNSALTWGLHDILESAGSGATASDPAVVTALENLLTELQQKVELGDTQPISGTVNLGTLGGAALDTTAQTVRDTTYEVRDRLGNSTDPAPESDTASSGLNGRLQRIAQNISTLFGRFPSSLGQKARDTSLSVVVASDQTALPVSATHAAPVISSGFLAGLGLSASVAVAGKTSFGAQLLWTGASTPQVVRLSGSFDGGSTWHLLGNTLSGEVFSVQDISDFANAGLQPGLRWRTTVPELTHVRLRWVSGTATNLTIKWGVA
jgi:hypothetical protein